jgi:dTDP-4-dehydrorhamnose 3,5-epimerase-like enzyme
MAAKKVRLVSLSNKKGAKGPRRIIEDRGELTILHPKGPVYNPVYFDVHAGPGFYRGGHYHKEKTENFYVISGACKIRFVDLETKEEGEVIAGPGDLVTVSPQCAHIVEAMQFCRVIEFSKEEMDYQRDTHTYEFDLP